MTPVTDKRVHVQGMRGLPGLPAFPRDALATQTIAASVFQATLLEAAWQYLALLSVLQPMRITVDSSVQ